MGGVCVVVEEAKKRERDFTVSWILLQKNLQTFLVFRFLQKRFLGCIGLGQRKHKQSRQGTPKNNLNIQLIVENKNKEIINHKNI